MLNLLREKAILTLAILLVLGIVIGVAHTRAVDKGAPFPLQDAARFVLRPAASAFHSVLSAGEHVIRFARPRRSILKENTALRKEVLNLRRENAVLREAAGENARLRSMLGMRQSVSAQMIAAEIISRKENSWFDTATIDRGRRSGAIKGAAVITTGWRLIGQVLEADTFTSQVVALSDSDSAIGAMVQRSRSSGILQGQGSDYLILSYLPKDADVKRGDVVVSSGMGQVIPKGLVIGRVVRVVHNKVLGSTSALVKPSIRFDQVEQVFLVKPEQGLAL